MNISILIPNHSDLRMINMIQSIDYFNNEMHQVELLIVLNNPTDLVIKQVEEVKEKFKEKFLFNIIQTEYCNLGHVYNEGFKNATYDNIFIIDTDMICQKGSINKMVNAMGDKLIVKGKILFDSTNRIIRQARLVNTTNTIEPYIPAIIINRNVFLRLKDDFMFAVDTVWCSDAEFANRIINEKIDVVYTDATFYHEKIAFKKDLKDAFLYGFGKAIRIKRTKEEWKPLREINNIYQSGKINKLSFDEQCYSIFWMILLQIACAFQKHLPPLFKSSLPFSKSASIRDVIKQKNILELRL